MGLAAWWLFPVPAVTSLVLVPARALAAPSGRSGESQVFELWGVGLGAGGA